MTLRSTTRKNVHGWTLIELLLVLMIVASLTAILVYTYVGSIHRQEKATMVVANVEDLIRAAHNWRLNQVYTAESNLQLGQYGGIMIGNQKEVPDNLKYSLLYNHYLASGWVYLKGFGWARNGASTYSIAAEDRGYGPCNVAAGCFSILISNLDKNGTSTILAALTATNPLNKKPLQTLTGGTSILVYYD